MICTLLTLEWFLQSVGTPGGWHSERRTQMDPKLALLFVLIGTVVGLSHMTERRETAREQVSRAWRKLRPAGRRA